MSTILFINGYRMLQQAVAVSLFPDHEVRVSDKVPDPAIIGEVEVVIVNAVSPEEGDGMIARAAREVLKWNIPVIWIEDPGSSQAPECDRVVVIKTPLQRSALHAAVTESLSRGKPGPASETAPAAHGSTSSGPVAAERPATPAEGVGQKKVIELLDVVEAPDIQIGGKVPPPAKP
jgi:hypothetical protein